MLIDNKLRYPNDGLNIKSVWNFISKFTNPNTARIGKLDIVTGFFSVAGLSALYNELSPENKYRLILAEMVNDDDFKQKIIDLLQGDMGVESSLRLSEYAQNAVAFLQRNTVEVRAITNAFCHAKTYLFKDKCDPAHNYFIMGSSNLTDAGLGRKPSSNIELNIAETGNNATYNELNLWFADQWKSVAQEKILIDPKNKKSALIDVKQFFIEQIANTFRTYTPKEIYYKILFELFQAEIDFDISFEHEKEMTLWQDSEIWRTLFSYQKSGVVSIIKMLRKWNGAILADAVGLGKNIFSIGCDEILSKQWIHGLATLPQKT